jgi:predicted PurR-regulated permease PerM
MKKFIKKIMVLMACFCVGFGFAFSPIVAGAEEPTIETPPATNEEITESPKIPETSNEELTFDDILGVFGGIAESEGYGSEWERVVEQLKTAASEKQVTLATVAVVVMLAVFIAYLVFKAVKRKEWKKTFKQLSDDLRAVSAVANEQLKGTNALIDEANANVKVSEKTKAETETIKKEEQKIEKALSLLISAFMTFSEGCKYSASKKSVVEINCAQALKELESLGGQADENHEV